MNCLNYIHSKQTKSVDWARVMVQQFIVLAALPGDMSLDPINT